jgi:hypothetical protein
LFFSLLTATSTQNHENGILNGTILCPHFTLTGSGRVDFTTSMDFLGIYAVGKLPGTRLEHLPFGPAHTHKQQ